jgi:hypothetical protein
MSLARELSRVLARPAKRGPTPRRRAKALDQLRADRRVAEVDREPTDGWFITLATGWRSALDPMIPTHCFGATTLREGLAEVRRAEPCACAQCIEEAAQ